MSRHVFGGSAGLIRDGWSVMDGPTNWNPSGRATRVACVHPFTVRFQGWKARVAKTVSQANDESVLHVLSMFYLYLHHSLASFSLGLKYLPR